MLQTDKDPEETRRHAEGKKLTQSLPNFPCVVSHLPKDGNVTSVCTTSAVSSVTLLGLHDGEAVRSGCPRLGGRNRFLLLRPFVSGYMWAPSSDKANEDDQRV